jgi:Co/Zn/Cd efflux system component
LPKSLAAPLFGSLALVADGWHMSTHAAALTISAAAYQYARRHATNPRFAFRHRKAWRSRRLH